MDYVVRSCHFANQYVAFIQSFFENISIGQNSNNPFCSSQTGTSTQKYFCFIRLAFSRLFEIKFEIFISFSKDSIKVYKPEAKFLDRDGFQNNLQNNF